MEHSGKSRYCRWNDGKTAGHKELKMNSFDIVKAIIYSSSAWENRARIEWSEADGNDSQDRWFNFGYTEVWQ